MSPNEPIAIDTPRTGPTGPRTPEGKGRCRFNAVTHGLTRQTLVFTPAQAEVFHHHAASLHLHYQPAGPVEEALVRQIAHGIFQLDRAAAIEHGIFALALEHDPLDVNEVDTALSPARTWLEQGKTLALLTLYTKRIESKLAANKSELARLQAERRQAEKEAQSAPNPKSAPVPAEPSDPEDDESDFLTRLIARELARTEAFLTAQTRQFHPENPEEAPNPSAA